MKRKGGNLRSEVVLASSPGFAVDDVTDLQVHRPVGADEHVARCPLHHRRRHLRSVQTPPPHNGSLKKPELPARHRERARGGKEIACSSPPTKSLFSPLFLIFLRRRPASGDWEKKKQEMVGFLWWIRWRREPRSSCRVVLGAGGGLSASTIENSTIFWIVLWRRCLYFSDRLRSGWFSSVLFRPVRGLRLSLDRCRFLCLFIF